MTIRVSSAGQTSPPTTHTTVTMIDRESLQSALFGNWKKLLVRGGGPIFVVVSDFVKTEGLQSNPFSRLSSELLAQTGVSSA